MNQTFLKLAESFNVLEYFHIKYAVRDDVQNVLGDTANTLKDVK